MAKDHTQIPIIFFIVRKRRKNSAAANIAITGLVLVVGVFVIPQFSFAAFSEPTTTPMTGTPPTFLNGSTITQTKDGSLFIGPDGGSVVFCLNADTSKSIRDTANNANCIDAWSDIAPAGSYVRRQQNTIPSNPANPTTYGAADRGFATVIGNSANNQGISTVVKANDCAGLSGAALTTCTGATKYAVYATDGGLDTRSAAQLSGKSVIYKPPGTTAMELCLNGQCITQWSRAFTFGNAGVITLQSTMALMPDIGHASISGGTRFTRGLTVGRPTDTTSRSYTYGDGQCTVENGEDSVNSPNDCN